MKRSAVVVSLLAPSMLSGCAVLTPVALAPLSRPPAPTSATADGPSPSMPAPPPPVVSSTTNPPTPTATPTPTGTVLLGEDTGSENGTELPSLTFRGGPAWKHSKNTSTGQDQWWNRRLHCFVLTNTVRQSMGGRDAEASAARAAHLAATLTERATVRVRPHPTTPVTVPHAQARPVQFAAVSAQVFLKKRPLTYTVVARTMTRDTNTLMAILTCEGHDTTSQLRVAQLATSLQILDHASH